MQSAWHRADIQYAVVEWMNDWTRESGLESGVEAERTGEAFWMRDDVG